MFSFIRRIRAAKCGTPFRTKEWYNFRAHISKDTKDEYAHIEIFDTTKPKYSQYIPCPSYGGTVVYNNKGKRYLYKIVGFRNESRDRDWLYDTDYINIVIEFVRPLKEGEFSNLS